MIPFQTHLGVKIIFFIIIFSLLGGSYVLGNVITEYFLEQTNLLFIIFDDLRPELSIYGRQHMITPNFDRLASLSVTFDNAYCQISVCNPSRDSLLTGIRPDTTGSYAFEWSAGSHITLPASLSRSGYVTAGYGKVFHWDSDDPNQWNFGHWDGNWYDYQNQEKEKYLNASVQPDSIHSEDWFRDYNFTTTLINSLKVLNEGPNYFMTAIGFKLPHLQLHMPYKYFAMYKGLESKWALQKKELRFPLTSPAVSYRCCAEPTFDYLKNEGKEMFNENIMLAESIDDPIPVRMYNEIMTAYCASITYLDTQIGRILDTLDNLGLWNNITIVLTSDHGMHNGEKGIWEKWTLFDESTRVPLMIYHPDSPFKGQHYGPPVELIDIFPTVNDLVGVPFNASVLCPDDEGNCAPRHGKSLAPVVLGDDWEFQRGKRARLRRKRRRKMIRRSTRSKKKSKAMRQEQTSETPKRYLRTANTTILNTQNKTTIEDYHMPVLERDFAISQLWRCADKKDLRPTYNVRRIAWRDCTLNDNYKEEREEQISVMGYAMRTIEFRYIAWFYMNRTSMIPMFDTEPFEEELYDHRNEKLTDYTHLELVNLAKRRSFMKVANFYRDKLTTFLRNNVTYHGPYPPPDPPADQNQTEQANPEQLRQGVNVTDPATS